MDDALIGRVVGQYRIERPLGAGGMGRVYATVHPTLGRRIAIKVLGEQFLHDADMTARFWVEARVVMQIRHPNIVRVLDAVALPDGRPALLMELVEGASLRSFVRGGRAPLGGVVTAMQEVLAALAAAHASGLVHRDLKPDNILVGPTGHVTVLDFGIAKQVRPDPAVKAPRTQTGVALGTPEYMAPEQVTGAPVDARTDLYSAGIVLFEAITGVRPFSGASDFELMRAHLELAPPMARVRRPAVPAALDRVIECALAKRPEDRFRNAIAMATALHAASAELPAEEWRTLQGGHPLARPAVAPTLVDASASIAELMSPLPAERSPAQTAAAPTVAGSRKPIPRGTTPRRPRPRIAVAVAVAVAALAGTATAVVLVTHRRGTPQRPAAEALVDVTTPIPLDLDRKQFDASAFLPRATELARARVPGARLFTASFGEMDDRGRSDLTTVRGITTLEFRASPAANQRSCSVVVELTSRGIVLSAGGETDCQAPSLPEPRCTLAQINVLARRHLGTAGKLTARYRGDESSSAQAWLVSSTAGRRLTMADDCLIGEDVMARPTPALGSRSPDYDGAHFDAIAYLPRALALARSVFPDAELVAMTAPAVAATGFADLRASSLPTEILFRSESHSQTDTAEAGASGIECYVKVSVYADHQQVEIESSPLDRQCALPSSPLPRCSLGELRRRSTALGLDAALAASVYFAGGEFAVVGPGPALEPPPIFPDDCPE